MNEPINDTAQGHGKHWSVEQAADRLGMSAEGLSQLIGSGALRADNRGPLGARISESEIIRFKSQLAQPPPPPAGPRVPGLSELESAVLLALWTADRPLTMAEITKTGNVPAGSAVRLLDKLLAAELVRRTRRAQPRPAWCYRATQSASEYAESLVRQLHDAISQVRASPSPAEEDQ
jgi:DNA-binding MarR family transcriptional regulator